MISLMAGRTHQEDRKHGEGVNGEENGDVVVCKLDSIILTLFLYVWGTRYVWGSVSYNAILVNYTLSRTR